MVRPAFLRGQGVTVKIGIRRCAVYTRKSSEEGLEQDFNSLHAQREACEAFIRSQRGEGWRLVETGYDDGGLSGGTLERPALHQGTGRCSGRGAFRRRQAGTQAPVRRTAKPRFENR